MKHRSDIPCSTPSGSAGPAARACRLLLAALLLAALACAALGWLRPECSSSWLVNALTSRLFLLCAALALGGLAGLIVVGRFLCHAAAFQRRRPRLASQRGAAIVEFALAMPILLGLVLLMAQVTLLMAANLCVHYAAFCAARAAVVQIPGSDPSAFNISNDAKLGRITSAAVWAVIPISCGNTTQTAADASLLTSGLSAFYDQYGQAAPHWIDASLPYRLAYALNNTFVSLAHDPATAYDGSDNQESDTADSDSPTFGQHEDVVVKVTHSYYLSIPYINRIFKELLGGSESTPGEYKLDIQAACRLPNEGVQDWIDIETFPHSN